MAIEIRHLTANNAEALRQLRLAALELEPRAFGETPAEFRALRAEDLAERIGNEEHRFILGAFDGPLLVGMAGLVRETRARRRHKARIWGVFVVPAHRRSGAGRALLSALVEAARGLPGLRLLQLSVALTQQPARALYLSLGFRPYGIEPHALHANGEYIDEEHMYLRLN